MKKTIFYTFLLFIAGVFGACKKDGNYPGGRVSPYVALFDVRNAYKGAEVTLSTGNLAGADKISVVVTSGPAGNIPAGIITVQDARRLGQVRGIAIPLGTAAANYVRGDSLIINVAGKIVKRENNILQLTGVTAADITKVASGRTITPLIVRANEVLAALGNYESTLVSFTSVGFDPSHGPGSTYSGDKIINDGFGNLILHTETSANFANDLLPFLSNFTGLIFTGADGKPQLWPRDRNDITILSATAPRIASILISGFLADVGGTTVTDANYEYIQLYATRNIDFAVTPFSIVTTNNAGANTPTGFPVAGWATGDLRTYKINLTSGTVTAGQYFYVGANKTINGPNTTDISSSKWFTKMYATVDGDGFGTKTTNLLANSGNGAGIAIFDKITVDAESIPIDVIFYGGAGNLFTAGPPPRGYRITNTDYYNEVNPINLAEQPFYTQGANTGKFAFPTGSSFAKLTGKYNKTTGRWTGARLMTNVGLTATSQVTEIEGGITLEQ